jgi:hypothetical protein
MRKEGEVEKGKLKGESGELKVEKGKGKVDDEAACHSREAAIRFLLSIFHFQNKRRVESEEWKADAVVTRPRGPQSALHFPLSRAARAA